MAEIVYQNLERLTPNSGNMLVHWQCAKCGAENESVAHIEGDLIKQQAQPAKSGKKQKKNYAARADRNSASAKILKQAEKKQYHTAKLHCSCEQCGSREPWADYQEPKQWIYYLLLSGAVLVFFGGYTGKLALFIGGLVLAAAFVVALPVSKSVLRKRTEKKLAELPETSLPTLLLYDWSGTGKPNTYLECAPGKPARKRSFPAE